MSCTICQHPKRQEIDQALIAGSSTLAALSQEYGLSTSALHRHKAHLQANVNRAKDQLQDNLRQGCIFWLSQALEMAMATAKAAQTEGNFKVVLQALGHGTRIINLILKQDFQLDPKVVYGIMASDQWTTQTGLLPHDPQHHGHEPPVPDRDTLLSLSGNRSPSLIPRFPGGPGPDAANAP